jgi:hypothetical protein
MRLWSLNPSLLDATGLVACWREALLAQAVLRGQTRGYTRHPQLERFRACADPVGAIGAYLQGLLDAAERRGYSFDPSKIIRAAKLRLPVTSGQLDHEWTHLRAKLKARRPEWLQTLPKRPRAHPLFHVVKGDRESWEKA